MMSSQAAWIIRSATPDDHNEVRRLIQSAAYIHQHFDWVDALSLLGQVPYLIAFHRNRPVGCLACPPDPPQVAWIRIFAVGLTYTASDLWKPLWHEAISQAGSMNVHHAAALLSADWLAPHLEESGFRHINDVVILEWQRQSLPPTNLVEGQIRSMQPDDLPNVAEVDARAFGGIWRYSEKTLRQAFRRATEARVIEIEHRIAAYQISTESRYGAHLARLAVHPAWQRQGLGKSLVVDAIRRLMGTSSWKMSVNTQLDNTRSLQLYEQLGFKRKEQKYPVYETSLNS